MQFIRNRQNGNTCCPFCFFLSFVSDSSNTDIHSSLICPDVDPCMFNTNTKVRSSKQHVYLSVSVFTMVMCRWMGTDSGQLKKLCLSLVYVNSLIKLST